MKTTEIMPPDVGAYMLQAVREITAEQGAAFATESDVRQWLEKNFIPVCERARELMQSLAFKVLDNPRIAAEVSAAIARSVYDSIRATNPVAKYQPRYIAYAKAHGKTPEEMLASDGSMVNFLCWKP